MATITTKTAQTPAEMLVALQQARAAMPDAYDLPRTWSQRQVDAHDTRRAQLDAYIRGLQSVRISSADDLYAKRAPISTRSWLARRRCWPSRSWATGIVAVAASKTHPGVWPELMTVNITRGAAPAL
jgi:hypothetical protein